MLYINALMAGNSPWGKIEVNLIESGVLDIKGGVSHWDIDLMLEQTVKNLKRLYEALNYNLP